MRYVIHDDEQTFAPPYVQAGCALHGFALPADRPRLQAIVDRHLREPSGDRLRPRVEADHLLMYFCDFARSHSSDPIDARRGWLGEREFGIWVPICGLESRGPSFFVHAMIVDSGPAMCSGREVLGFPKQLGRVEVSREPSAELLSADTLVFGERRAEPGRWRPRIELDRVEPNGEVGLPGLDLLAELLGARGALDSLRRAGRRQAEFINLKQFRAADNPSQACYQAIVRSHARTLSVTRLTTTGTYAYRVCPAWVDALGVPESGRTRGLFCELDFELGLGETL